MFLVERYLSPTAAEQLLGSVARAARLCAALRPRLRRGRRSSTCTRRTSPARKPASASSVPPPPTRSARSTPRPGSRSSGSRRAVSSSPPHGPRRSLDSERRGRQQLTCTVVAARLSRTRRGERRTPPPDRRRRCTAPTSPRSSHSPRAPPGPSTRVRHTRLREQVEQVTLRSAGQPGLVLGARARGNVRLARTATAGHDHCRGPTRWPRPRHPDAVTRAISDSPRTGSRMKCTTSCARTRSNDSSRIGQRLRGPWVTSRSGNRCRAPHRRRTPTDRWPTRWPHQAVGRARPSGRPARTRRPAPAALGPRRRARRRTSASGTE